MIKINKIYTSFLFISRYHGKIKFPKQTIYQFTNKKEVYSVLRKL